jgi:hypothetical protein
MSFGILRTNVGLTTNIKIMVGSSGKLSLDSIESNDNLSLSRFKNFKFNESTLYENIIPIYYKGVSSDIAFEISNNSDVEKMSNNFSQQYSDLYSYGARNITNNKDYLEDFEYFAPLYFDGDLPNNFIIFRVDGPGIELLNKEDFKSSVLDNFKVVKLYDLTNNTNIGKWLSLNFKENKSFPKEPLEIDFRNLEFSKWNGINYQSGGYIQRSLFMDSFFESEREIFELEKFIFNNFKESKTVFPNILNLSFLFSDKPSTPEINKKWSLNRYYGFYLDDIELSYTISPYKTASLRDDVVILENNIILSKSSPNNPFKQEWESNKPFYVEYKGEYYLVERYKEKRGDGITKIQDDGFISEEYQPTIFSIYKIISDLNLEGKQDELNKNYGYIEDDILVFEDNKTLSDFNTADVWLIEIDGIFHKLIKGDEEIKINSDYSFNFSENTYEYKVGSVSSIVSLIVDFDNPPKKFNIYKCKFSDIKDFDNKIVDTEYSKFEYEKKNELTLTDETKMYLGDLSSKTNPKNLDDFNFKNNIVNIPVSSEYTANFETFKINEQGLSDIWKINPVYCRWVFKNSLSSNDYPYLMNNSSVFEIFNRTTNTFETEPNRSERNLDYFYTINSSTSSYIHHSLHVERVIDGDIDTNFKFDEDKYLNKSYNYDYFSYFFNSKSEFDKSRIKKNTKKYSLFNEGDSNKPNITLFRGIEFRIFDVESITLDGNNDINTINVSNSESFDNYKFSILLTGGDNGMDWDIVDEWKMDKDYASGSTVIFDDILYTSNTDNKTDNPTFDGKVKSAPYNLESWTYSTESSLNISKNIFWSPIKEYDKGDFVYNSDEYYFVSMTNSTIDFWNPITAQEGSGYDKDLIVLFKGDYYQSMTSSNIYPPDFMLNKTPIREFQEFKDNINSLSNVDKKLPLYWNKIEEPLQTKWKKVEVWNPSKIYSVSTGDVMLINHNDTIWSTNKSVGLGAEPGVDPVWVNKYSILPDSDFIYTTTNNSIIHLNNRYYVIKDNPLNKKLDNGIKIYINKKWKNILVNINFNDNTLPNISNSDRDDLYNDLYKSITANNFMSSITEFYNKNRFSNYLSYVIIEENGDINRYSFDNNVSQIPHLLLPYSADDFVVRFSSLTKQGFKPKIKINKSLNNGNIDNISKLNWYNNNDIAYSIEESELILKPVINYSGLKNPIIKIFRFSGSYMPLFYDIQLFSVDSEDRLTGNYKFDTTLTEFGIIKEVKIKKVNRKGSILKLKDNTTNVPIYPMIDEFGHTVTDLMIFKSTWDKEYHVETSTSTTSIKGDLLKITKDSNVEAPINIGQPKVVKVQNLKKYNL